MKNRKLNKIVLCCLLFVSPFLSMADDIGDGNGDGDVNDNTPAAPIDAYVPLLFLAATGLGYVLLVGRKPARK